MGTSVPPSEHQLHVLLENAHEICRFDEVDRLYSKISGGQDSPSAHVIYSSFPIPATWRINLGGARVMMLKQMICLCGIGFWFRNSHDFENPGG